MLVTPEQLQQISIFSRLEPNQLAQLQPHTSARLYLREEVILHEGDPLPAVLFAVLSGRIQIKKTAASGKETILRTLPSGEIFAAPSLFGDGVAPATVIAEQDCQILTVERIALMEMIRHAPELALHIIAVLTERLQNVHSTLHNIASERAIVRLARLIQTALLQEGTQPTADGLYLQSRLPYYQIARSIGITYEECVRLFKQIQPIVTYQRGGKIRLLDQSKLDALAQGLEAD
jgi:CRP/FNR family transcriptional regulator, cyclic AMP receptor protein